MPEKMTKELKIILNSAYEKAYNNAIEDFLEVMEEWNNRTKTTEAESVFFTIGDIREVAERLKK